jgi:nitrous oxidase accessory protein NosD
MSDSLTNHSVPRGDWLATLAAQESDDAPGTGSTLAVLPIQVQPSKTAAPAPKNERSGSWIDTVLDDGEWPFRGRKAGRAEPEEAERLASLESASATAGSAPAAPSRRWKLAVLVLTGVVALQFLGAAGYFFLMRPMDPQPPVPQPSPNPQPIANEIVVSPGDDGQFHTIGEAIRKAEPGTRIRVKPGTYRESLVLDKRLHIVGDGPGEQIVIEAVGSSCLTMNADFATVQGLTLRGRAGRDQDKAFAVYIPKGQLVLEDCSISGESPACVGIESSYARPILRRCKIHDGKVGVLVDNGASGTLEGCEIFNHAEAAVRIRNQASPLLRRCTIRNNKLLGVQIINQGGGVLLDCTISAKDDVNVLVRERSEPTLRGCTIQGGKGNGLVFDNSGGEVTGCVISAHDTPEVVVRNNANPVLRGCQIRGSKNAGVYILTKGKGLFYDCEITGNVSGIVVNGGDQPVFILCKVQGNRQGIEVVGQSQVHIVRCDLTNNSNTAWYIQPGSQVTGTGNTPAQPGSVGGSSPATGPDTSNQPG